MKETIFKIFDTFTEGVDTYYHNGSMWLIFTDEQKWVIELDRYGILWYNSYFFGDCLKYVSLDVVENQHYITEWVENIIQNGVKDTKCDIANEKQSVEDTIQNGVKGTRTLMNFGSDYVDGVIQNGIKELKGDGNAWVDEVREVTEKGIKQTIELPDMSGQLISYGKYYARQKDKTYSHDNIVNDVINGN
jgi:hypothetical protein